jgi:hypothetical protein
MNMQRQSDQPTDMPRLDCDRSNSRRKFLTGVAAVGAAFGLVREVQALQGPGGMPSPKEAHPPRSAETDPNPNAPSVPSPEKRMLEENEKEIRKKVDQLYALATELKAEVDKTDSSKVLSLNMLKKAEEIEHLAHDIKNRSKG